VAENLGVQSRHRVLLILAERRLDGLLRGVCEVLEDVAGEKEVQHV
jgi:hypothetical protein